MRWSGSWEARMNRNLLGMLGLAQRGGMLAAGEGPAQEAAQQKSARLLLLASDATANTERRIRHFAEEGCCLWARAPFTKEELGGVLGRASCAILAITDTIFSAAIARRLADEDPASYGELAAKLDIKAKRAAERKAEHRSREKAGERTRRSLNSSPAEKRGEETPAARKRRPPDGRYSRPAGSHTAEKGGRGKGGGNSPDFRKSRRSSGRDSQAQGSRKFSRTTSASHPGRPFSGSLPVKKGKGSFRRNPNGK